ncbi:MAG TPA: FAD-dependent oxidoreductase [Patescibacteria group bacterium]|nr:FAD-dependent oxidoreductase [Patescibacteria group bacterium]
MKAAVVGGGILGLTLAHRLARAGHAVHLLEAGPVLGGLAASQDYGPFVWDRFYHCILPQDQSLIALLDELGLKDALRWTKTGTGYYARGRFHDMNGNRDFLRFPLLSAWDKARLGAAVLYATRIARPEPLYLVTAAEWLTRICGRRGYEVFWQPLLRAKFGPFHDQVAAVFIYATLKRLFGARSAAAGSENLGYVHGGYHAILGRFAESLRAAGARVRTGAPVRRIEGMTGAAGSGAGPASCRVTWADAPGSETSELFDQVFFTAPTGLARQVVGPELRPVVERFERDNPTAVTYLGVACLVLVLEKPLTPYYVLNIGEPSVELTGLIEMTNLISRPEETRGLSLIYLPRYMDSASDQMEAGDAALREGLIDRGLKRLFPGFEASRALYAGVHRARHVQPLPLVRDTPPPEGGGAPELARPFQVVNTALLRCATLNNNEVVALVDRFMAANAAALSATSPTPR